MKISIYDVIEDWKNPSRTYEDRSDALTFFEDIHKTYYDNYRIVEISEGKAIADYSYSEFVNKFPKP